MNTPRPIRFLIALTTLAFAATGCSTVRERGQFTPGLDLDGDGVISRDELARKVHDDSLDATDLNGDNYISYSEWASAHPAPGQADKHFNRIDKDGDGKIEMEEGVLYINEHVRFGDLFSEIDQDTDGTIQFREYSDQEDDKVEFTILHLGF
jgi:Ca2+-binding EF-hand superfamily protein